MLSKSIPILLAKGENLISTYMGIDLTNLRLYKTTNRGTIENLYLKNLDSCEFQLISNPFYLVVGALLFILSIVLYTNENNGAIAGTIVLVIGLAAVLLFFLLRRQALRFRAGSSIISVAVSGNDIKQAQEFINNVVAAKSSTI